MKALMLPNKIEMVTKNLSTKDPLFTDSINIDKDIIVHVNKVNKELLNDWSDLSQDNLKILEEMDYVMIIESNSGKECLNIFYEFYIFMNIVYHGKFQKPILKNKYGTFDAEDWKGNYDIEWNNKIYFILYPELLNKYPSKRIIDMFKNYMDLPNYFKYLLSTSLGNKNNWYESLDSLEKKMRVSFAISSRYNFKFTFETFREMTKSIVKQHPTHHKDGEEVPMKEINEILDILKIIRNSYIHPLTKKTEDITNINKKIHELLDWTIQWNLFDFLHNKHLSDETEFKVTGNEEIDAQLYFQLRAALIKGSQEEIYQKAWARYKNKNKKFILKRITWTTLTNLIDEGMSREEAYDTVQPIAINSFEKELNFREEILKNKNIVKLLGEDKINFIFDDMEHFMKESKTILKRVGITK